MQDTVVRRVVEKFQERSNVGIKKYGTTLEQNNKDNYLLHLQQEMMDGTLYLEKNLMIHEEVTGLCNKYTNDAELGNIIRKIYAK